MPVLMLLTVDRFIAVVLPLKYNNIMKTSHCKILIAAIWTSLLVVLISDAVLLGEGVKVCQQYISIQIGPFKIFVSMNSCFMKHAYPISNSLKYCFAKHQITGSKMLNYPTV